MCVYIYIYTHILNKKKETSAKSCLNITWKQTGGIIVMYVFKFHNISFGAKIMAIG